MDILFEQELNDIRRRAGIITETDADNVSSAELFVGLKRLMPPIGFASQSKRIEAFKTITDIAQDLYDEGVALEKIHSALILLHNEHKPFMKACVMVAMNVDRIADLSPLGRSFATTLRDNQSSMQG